MKFLFGLLVIVLCSTVINAAMKLSKDSYCGPKKQLLTVKSIDMAGCQDPPCILTRGTNASVKMELVPQQRITGLKLSIHGILSGKEVPFSVDDTEHCKRAIKDGKCPLVRNKTYKYQNSITVLKQYPAITVTIRYQINDLNGKPLLCVQWPAKIV